MRLMKYLLGLLCVIVLNDANGQDISRTQPFGVVDKGDLLIKSSDLEKDAVGEILFDKASLSFNSRFEMIIERHRRIKIFNENAKSLGDISIPYFNYAKLTNLQAQTINLKDGVPVITPVEKNQVFVEHTDDIRRKTIFAFPNVAAGSIIEYKYTITYSRLGDLPTWYFQNSVPTRYSEIRTDIPENVFNYKTLEMVTQPFAVNYTDNNGITIKALANVPSLQNEPFMTTIKDNSQRIAYQLVALSTGEEYLRNNFDTWRKVGEAESKYLARQLESGLPGTHDLIVKAKTMKTAEGKVAYLFKEVKKAMKWDGRHSTGLNESLLESWKKQAGNSAAINLILCRLLQRSGVNALPMLTSTRDNGRVYVSYTNPYQFNTMVVYVPIDSARRYILDASNKFNLYNQIPQDLLNSSGLFMDADNDAYELIFLENTAPVNTIIVTKGEITSDGKLEGNAEISSYGYNKTNIVTKFTKDGEAKYCELLKNGDESMLISSLKLEDREDDMLPLKQSFDFSTQLSGENDHLYLAPNLFGSLKLNPFLSERRMTDIDFGFRDNYSITGTVKLPAGYKAEALPKSLSLKMPDESIVCRRYIVEEGGIIIVRFVIDYKKSIYFKEDYPEFHEFCKKMHEMLNEQIVLKKS